jgi:Ca2+-binding EF-hand superfamily protein
MKIDEIQLRILVFIVNFIVRIDNEDQLSRVFHQIDIGNDGVLSESEISKALISFLNMPSKEADKLAK